MIWQIEAIGVPKLKVNGFLPIGALFLKRPPVRRLATTLTMASKIHYVKTLIVLVSKDSRGVWRKSCVVFFVESALCKHIRKIKLLEISIGKTICAQICANAR